MDHSEKCIANTAVLLSTHRKLDTTLISKNSHPSWDTSRQYFQLSLSASLTATQYKSYQNKKGNELTQKNLVGKHSHIFSPSSSKGLRAHCLACKSPVLETYLIYQYYL